MLLPQPRGELSAALFDALRRDALRPTGLRREPTDDEDLHIALWSLCELAYRGFDDVDPRYEWAPPLIEVRGTLERSFEAGLRTAVAPALASIDSSEDVAAGLQRLTGGDGVSIADYLHRDATIDEFREFMILRSIYHLKEADPHAWLLPRLAGAAKVALAEILYDEYGDGQPERNHQQLFVAALRALDLDATYGAYIDQVPASTLAVSNGMSLLCFNRRLLAAGAGHLAAFEMTSSLPSRRIAQGIDRLCLPADVARYFEEHIEADAVHEQVAARDLCGSLVTENPGCIDDVLLGGAVSVHLESASAEATLSAWAGGASALRSAQMPIRRPGRLASRFGTVDSGLGRLING